MEIASRIIILTVGGAFGVNARYWLSLLMGRWLGVKFPFATFLINVSGSFAIGFLAMVMAERWPQPNFRIFAVTGFLGGYTTFSAYMFESFLLWERGERLLAAANLLGSLITGLLAVFLGVCLSRWMFEPPHAPNKPILGHEVKIEQRMEAISDALSGMEPPKDPTRSDS